MKSLRARLFFSAIMGTSLIFAVSGVVIYAVVRERLRANLDSSLEALVRTSVATIMAEQGWGELDSEEPEPRFTLDGVCFSPWIDEQDPRSGAFVSRQQLWDRLQLVRRDARSIRTYGVGGGLQEAPRLIHLLDLESIIGGWIGIDHEENARELETLVDLAHDGHVDLAVVGNEVISRGDLEPAELIALLQDTRAKLPAGVPLATAEPWAVWLGNPALFDAVDRALVNYHPYWHGIPVEDAVTSVACWHVDILAAAAGKPVLVGETGWPSSGVSFGESAATPEAATRYMREFVAWARLNDVQFKYFSAFDETWKASDEGEAGPHWGYRNDEGSLKPGLRAVFDGPLSPKAAPAVEVLAPDFSGQAPLVGQVHGVGTFTHRIAIYLRTKAGWWTRPTYTQPLTAIGCDGTFKVDLFSETDPAEARELLVVVVRNGYTPPILSGAEAIPKALLRQAVAIHEVVR